MWKYLASKKEKPLVAGCLTIPQIWEKVTVLFFPTIFSELRNVNSFTRNKTLELNFTPRKARKSRQFWDLSETKLTKNDSFGEQMLTTLSNH